MPMPHASQVPVFETFTLLRPGSDSRFDWRRKRSSG
jgi:hypothetical protein